MLRLELSWLKNTNFWLLACFIFLISCGEGPPENIPVVDRKFRTTPPSRIFFKNIRSIAYQWEQDGKSRTDYYLLRKIAGQKKKPLIYPVIADIWMEDQAQLILKSGAYDPLPTPLLVHWASKNEAGIYQLDSLHAEGMYEVGLQIYQSIRKAHSLEISFPDTNKMPLFGDLSERSHFMTSMQDYLRLTEFY